MVDQRIGTLDAALQEVNDVLYHYTGTRGLVGMLEKQELWFSDIRFLNDSSEFNHTCNMISDSIRRHADMHRQNWIDHECKPEVFDRMVENLRKKCHGDALYHRISKYDLPFIFSLSNKRDNLGQWRAYGNGEYCIGFDRKKLWFIQSLNMMKIKYSKAGQGDPGPSILPERFFNDHLKHIRPGGIIDPEVFNDGLDDIIAGNQRSNLFFENKNEAFVEEQEVRLVVRRNLDDKTIFFDPNGRYPVPRARVTFPDVRNGLSDAITEIICGPGMDYSRSYKAISLMGQRTINRPFKVSESTVPYRTG